jgi:hypothetical protein
MIYLKETYTPPAAEDFEQAVSAGLSIWDGLYALHPEYLSKRLSEYYRTDPLFSRTINQIAEQAMAEWEPEPTLAGSSGAALTQWWTESGMARKFERVFKEFLIAGEIWCYLPLKDGVPMPRFLVPWQLEGVVSPTGEAEDWTSARYLPGAVDAANRVLDLTPKTTYYYAHDAMFASTRGVPPFGAMAPALERYRRWLTSRERITRMAGKVLGHLVFPTAEDAVASLGWRRSNDGGLEPKPIKLPTDEAMVVTIGNGSDFRLVVPSVGGGDAAADGRAFYLQVIEASRLPEFMSGDGSNVNVATARVQYPFAVRSILALRDSFSRAMAGVCRLALERIGRPITPSEQIVFDWPEMRELDYDLEANVLFQLYDRGLVAAQEVLSQLGYTGSAPGAVPPAAAAEAAKRAVESAVTAYLEGHGLE